MSGPEPISEALAARLARLSPTQRALLKRRLGERGRRAHGGGERTDAWPLSRTQFGIWFFEQLEPGTSAYNNAAALRLRGPLDIAALRAALELIHRRHDALRSRYLDDDGLPFAVIGETPLPFRATDVSDAGGSPQEKARSMAIEAAHASFDLAEGPVWRALLVRVGPDDHVLVVTLHHLVSDGWSLGILLDELRLAYEACGRGEEPSLPRLPARYVEVVQSQERELRRDAGTLLAYWLDRLRGFPQHVALPYDAQPGATYRGASLPIALPRDVVEALEAFCARQRATLFAGLLAAFAALLHGYARQTAVVVTTPVAGREDPRSQRLIGCFLNTVPLPLRLDGDPTLAELVRRSRDTLFGALAHSRLPFADLVTALPAARSSRERPISNVMLVQNNAPLESLGFGGLAAERFPLPVASVRQDWAINVARTAAGLVGEFEFTSDCFRPSTIERAIARFTAVVETLVSRPETSLAALADES